jgi:ABC-type polysaccharide transport system permease subunit
MTLKKRIGTVSMILELMMIIFLIRTGSHFNRTYHLRYSNRKVEEKQEGKTLGCYSLYTEGMQGSDFSSIR